MNEHRCYGCMQLHEGDFCPHCGWPAGKNNEVHQLPVGTVLHGQYEVGRVLGQGGFGITYLGWDRQLGAAVCIKEYFPSHAVSRDCTVSTQVRCHTEAGAESFRLSKERFLREGRVLAQFREIPEIVSVYGSFEENDTVYIVMEYIKGMDLAHYVNHRGGRLSAEETFKILKPVMEALARVHRSELVHRDIAPDNIMLHPRGGAKLLDFGAARMVENADVDKGLDRSTEAIVKHGFAPMEQYQTRGNLGPWTDVYAMCASVYYCLTGQIPPEATSRLMGEADFSWADVPGLTDRQRQALEHGMAVLPKDRYRSMEDLLDGLFGSAPMPMTYTEPVYAAPQVPSYGAQTTAYMPPQAPVYVPPTPAPAPKKRSKLLPILGGALAAVALLVGGTLLAVGVRNAISRPAAPEPPVAMPAPVETAAPAEEPEAPVAEVPAETEPIMEWTGEYNVGMIFRSGVMTDIPEQLMKQLASTGANFTLETVYAQPDEIAEYAAVFIASGQDAIVIQDLDPSSEYAQSIFWMAEDMGIPVILIGADPSYGYGTYGAVEEFSCVCYAGFDPVRLADRLVDTLLGCQTEPDRDGDGIVSCVFLGGAGMDWENSSISWRIPLALQEKGYVCAVLAEEYGSAAEEVLTEALLNYGPGVEAIFCTDLGTAEMAERICMEYGIDLYETTIIAMGDTEQMAQIYERGYIGGYVEYTREMWCAAVAEALGIAVREVPLEDWYDLPCNSYYWKR